MKKIIIGLFLSITVFLVGCQTTTLTTTELTTEGSTTTQIETTQGTTSVVTLETTTTNSTSQLITEIEDEVVSDVSGIENAEVIRGHYFNVLKGVNAYTSLDRDVTSLFSVSGYVDFGTIGNYDLVYTLDFNGETYMYTRTVSVVNGTYIEPTGQRPLTYTGSNFLGSGSYYSGTTGFIEHPVNPGYIANDLLDVAIPSTGWWTTLLVENYGGSNGIYTNPLRTAFSNEGLEITNPEDGFVQYWDVGGDQTIAQFPISIKDLFLKSSALGAGYVTEVIDYSDNSVKVAMRNTGSAEDEVVVTLVQGSPYIFAETNNKSALSITMEQGANVEFYDLEGNLIDVSSHIGDSIIIKYVQRHSGYNCTPPSNVLGPQYSDKFYLVNTPDNTSFTMINNVLGMSLTEGNYISVVALNDLTEASYYHSYGYSMINKSTTTFEVEYETSMVYTDYIASYQQLRSDSSTYPLQVLMPHHYKNSDVTLSDYSYRTVRGTLKVMEGNYFQTELSFNGLLPGYTLPENTEFSSGDMVSYLETIESETSYEDLENFFNDDGPYWNSKALYPLAQGIIIADQLGEEELKISFIGKLNYLLQDWYTFSDFSDERYLYYNNAWGSVYYSNNDFGTATGLSDHSFTHGYLIYASSVLAMYDNNFINDYGLLVDLLLDDYMFTERGNESFEYLRNFDAWAGHSWAHGFGNFAEGNNLESTSEALNSWNAGYLWALATGDEERMETAIYGFVTELTSIKEYWFDWDDENWDPAFGDYVDVAGMIWGGKHDYATWFGANPTFIYGIQWLPTGEYLTNYAISDYDYDKLASIFATYLEAKDGTIDTWYSNMWFIQAITDSETALSQFDADLILNDDYPAELAGSYWMINALDSIGRRTNDIWMEIQMGVSSTIYEAEDGTVYAMIWNVSNEEKTVDYYNEDGLLTTVTVDKKSFTKVVLD